TVSLAVGGYLAVTAVIQLVAGPLSDRIGRRPVLLGALAVFTLASIGCAVAREVWMFLAFRVLQGAIISGYALSLAIVRDTTSERRAAGIIGYISMAMAVAPMLGPMLGGVLDTTLGWRANFVFYAISGLCLFVLSWVDLGETRPAAPDRAATRSVGALTREPLFWAYSLCGAFSTGAFYIFLTGAPLVAQSVFGVSTAELGVYIGTITAGFMLGSALSGRFAARFDPTTMMLAGRLTACTGLTAGLCLLWMGHSSAVLFFGSTVFVGLGNGLTMPSSSASAMSVRPDLAGSAAGWNGALIVACGAVLTTLTGLILPQEGGAVDLLVLMLVASAAGVPSVLWARRVRGSARRDAA
ncbi:MAG: MFS transporter, partial [Pseudomonadota bacterium]